jgi:hypothetical protein
MFAKYTTSGGRQIKMLGELLLVESFLYWLKQASG